MLAAEVDSVIGALLLALVVHSAKEGLLGPLLFAKVVAASGLSAELSPRHELYVCGGTSSSLPSTEP